MTQPPCWGDHQKISRSYFQSIFTLSKLSKSNINFLSLPLLLFLQPSFLSKFEGKFVDRIFEWFLHTESSLGSIVATNLSQRFLRDLLTSDWINATVINSMIITFNPQGSWIHTPPTLLFQFCCHRTLKINQNLHIFREYLCRLCFYLCLSVIIIKTINIWYNLNLFK